MALEENRGKVLSQWSFPETVRHARGQAWFITMGIVAALLVIYAIVTMNFLFALIIVLAAAITMLHHYREPIVVACTLYELGVEVGHKFWSYKDLKKFWIIYEPPHVKKLYFIWQTAMKPILSVPLGDQNPLKVRELLGRYLEEDLEKEREPLTEGIARVLKL